jgi:hypothetical protein
VVGLLVNLCDWPLAISFAFLVGSLLWACSTVLMFCDTCKDAALHAELFAALLYIMIAGVFS